MSPEMIFGAAMGLVDPWYITKVEFEKGSPVFGSGQLDRHIDFKPGWKFNDPGINALCPVHDTIKIKYD